MKKATLLITAVLFCINVYAQDKFRLTFVASPQVSWLNSKSSEVSKKGSIFGVDYGVETDIFFGSKKYAFTTGLTLTHTGGKLKYNTANDFSFAGEMLPSGTLIKYDIRYIEIPLALKMRTREFIRTTFFAHFGLVNWLRVWSRGSSSDGTLNRSSIPGEVNFFSMGLNVGLGVEYDMGGDNALTLGLVYMDSFIDATSNSGVGSHGELGKLRMRLGFIF